MTWLYAINKNHCSTAAYLYFYRTILNIQKHSEIFKTQTASKQNKRQVSFKRIYNGNIDNGAQNLN